jgi:malate dehydrogenase
MKAGKVSGNDLLKTINDDAWVTGPFTSTIQKRGAEIIEFRGASSAASAGSSAIDHIFDWEFGSEEWVSMCIPAKGNK